MPYFAFYGYPFHSSHLYKIQSQGTYWDFETSVELSQTVRSDLLAYLRSRDEEFSEWSESSKLRLIEKQGYTKPFALEGRLLFMFQFVSELEPQIRELFDPSVEKHRRNMSHLTGSWKDLQRLGVNRFQFQKDPGALTFSGAVKGMETAELGLLLETYGFQEYSVNAGGGNRLILSQEIYTIQSYSGSIQNDKNATLTHIRDPRNPSRVLNSRNSKVECVYQKGTGDELIRLATLADILSTVTLLEEKIFIPNGCKLLVK